MSRVIRRPSFERPNLQQKTQILLHAAGSAKADAPGIVRTMLNSGVSANCTDTSGFTPLALACRAGNLSVVQMILQQGGDPSIASRGNQNPPMFWAAAADNVEIVKLLLEAKAQPDQTNVGGDTALLWACRSGAGRVVGVLLSKCPPLLDLQNNSAMTPLICACAGKHAHIVKSLLTRTPPPKLDLADNNGRTALHFAATNSAECVDALLKAGADWSKRSVNGLTPLGEAKAQGPAEAVRLLESAWEEHERRQQSPLMSSGRGNKAAGAGGVGAPVISADGKIRSYPPSRKASFARCRGRNEADEPEAAPKPSAQAREESATAEAAEATGGGSCVRAMLSTPPKPPSPKTSSTGVRGERAEGGSQARARVRPNMSYQLHPHSFAA